MEASLGGSWAQFGLGLTGRISEKVGVFAAADYNVSLDEAGQSFGGRAGIRVIARHLPNNPANGGRRNGPMTRANRTTDL